MVKALFALLYWPAVEEGLGSKVAERLAAVTSRWENNGEGEYGF